MFVRIDEIKIFPNRKKIAFVFKQKKIILIVPAGITEKQILETLEKNKEKIIKLVEKWRKKNNIKEIKIKPDDNLLYFGKKYPIKRVKDTSEYVEFKNDSFLISSTSMQNTKIMLVELFRKFAKQYIPNRVKELARLYGLSYKNCRITKAETRFGSCSGKNNLNFSLYLIMATHKVIDYVILHELVHTIHKNHSQEFWNTIKILMPDYEFHKNWLKNHAFLMQF